MSTSNKCKKPCDLQAFSYKLSCELLWNLDCGTHQSKAENKKLMNQLYTCLKKRKDYKFHCVKKECWDSGHDGAIDKMEKKVKHCEYILSLQS